MLSPLSFIYWLITGIRNSYYDFELLKSKSFDIPILSVGNLAVGGSGKTPMVEYLISQLDQDYNIAVLSRGYGRNTKGFRWVETSSSPSNSGDEPLQIKTKHQHITVAVCEKRVYGVERILSEKPDINLILLDDAFQHRAIKPKIQLLLSTYAKPFYTDWVLPSGRLRERRSGAHRSDAIIFTKCPPSYIPLEWNHKVIFYSKIVYQDVKIEGPIYGFSGLANNAPFRDYLNQQYNLTGFTEYPDHYTFTQMDVNKLISKAGTSQLVCTEKDWIKIRQFNNSQSIKHITIANTIEGDQDFIFWLKGKLS